MAEGIISFPFRVDGQGSVALVGYGTDQEVDEAIASLVLTQVGERPLQPEYGVPDPGWAGLHTGDVQTGLSIYGPSGVRVGEIRMVPTGDAEMVADVRWSRDDEQELT